MFGAGRRYGRIFAFVALRCLFVRERYQPQDWSLRGIWGNGCLFLLGDVNQSHHVKEQIQDEHTRCMTEVFSKYMP